ncbi:hypothetical protein [Methylobacterium sp. NFXW15]
MTGAVRLACALGGHLLRKVATLCAAACRLVLFLARACERRAAP